MDANQDQFHSADPLHYDCIVISDLHLGSDVCQAKLLKLDAASSGPMDSSDLPDSRPRRNGPRSALSEINQFVERRDQPLGDRAKW
jgi:hypothetical protein